MASEKDSQVKLYLCGCIFIAFFIIYSPPERGREERKPLLCPPLIGEENEIQTPLRGEEILPPLLSGEGWGEVSTS